MNEYDPKPRTSPMTKALVKLIARNMLGFWLLIFPFRLLLLPAYHDPSHLLRQLLLNFAACALMALSVSESIGYLAAVILRARGTGRGTALACRLLLTLGGLLGSAMLYTTAMPSWLALTPDAPRFALQFDLEKTRALLDSPMECSYVLVNGRLLSFGEAGFDVPDEGRDALLLRTEQGSFPAMKIRDPLPDQSALLALWYYPDLGLFRDVRLYTPGEDMPAMVTLELEQTQRDPVVWQITAQSHTDLCLTGLVYSIGLDGNTVKQAPLRFDQPLSYEPPYPGDYTVTVLGDYLGKTLTASEAYSFRVDEDAFDFLEQPDEPDDEPEPWQPQDVEFLLDTDMNDMQTRLIGYWLREGAPAYDRLTLVISDPETDETEVTVQLMPQETFRFRRDARRTWRAQLYAEENGAQVPVGEAMLFETYDKPE